MARIHRWEQRLLVRPRRGPATMAPYCPGAETPLGRGIHSPVPVMVCV